jgi:hypothetical protein
MESAKASGLAYAYTLNAVGFPLCFHCWLLVTVDAILFLTVHIPVGGISDYSDVVRIVHVVVMLISQASSLPVHSVLCQCEGFLIHSVNSD